MHVTHLQLRMEAVSSEKQLGGGEVTLQGKACRHTEDKKDIYHRELEINGRDLRDDDGTVRAPTVGNCERRGGGGWITRSWTTR